MAIFENVVKSLERADVIDPPVNAVKSVVNRVITPPVRGVLSGNWLGHPVHPILVTAPIGAWLSAGVLDVSRGDPVAARRLVGFGVCCAAVTAATGWSDWRITSGPAARVGLVHAVAMAPLLPSTPVRGVPERRGTNGWDGGLRTSAPSFWAPAGFLGGHLAYAMGVNVGRPGGPDRPG